MKAPLDEQQLLETCRKCALVSGVLTDYGFGRKKHEWYAVPSPTTGNGGIIVEFDEKGEVVFTVECRDDAQLTRMAAVFFQQSQ